MPTPDLLPFAALLAPISEEAPTGGDPRKTRGQSQKFDKVTDAFSTAAALEKREASGEGGPQTPVANVWGPVITAATELLSGQAKDMEVAVCLAQGLIRIHGVPGLRDGLRLIRELAENHWDGLHPLPGSDQDDEFPDEKASDDRVGFVERLQSQPVLTALRLTAITAGKGDGPFSYSDYVIATRMALTTGDEGVAEQGRQRKAKLLAAAAASGPDHYLRLIEDMERAVGHMDALENLLMEKTNSGGLVLGKLRETLGEVDRAVRDISRDVIPRAPEPAEAGGGPDDGAAGVPGTGSGPSGGGGGFRASGTNAARDREAALRCLSEISAFFKATEPHSPIGYTLDTLVARARMSLPALLEDLIPDEGTRQAILTTAGIRLPAPES